MNVLDGRRILVVDDSRAIRHALAQALSAHGAIVSQAVDGHDGLACAKSGEFDLVISDVDMPRLNGLEFCARLRQEAAGQDLPVIMLTSHDTDDDINQGFQAGASAYVSKLEGRDHFLEAVAEILERQQFRNQQVVLLVEDSMPTQALIRRGLEEAGFQVVAAGDGRQALALLAQQRPSLILSDINMPHMNGVALCRAVRADPALSTIPFVVMSADSQRQVMRQLLQLGAAAYLVKPFNIDQLVMTLDNHFQLLLKDRERLETERRMMLAGITSLIEALEARDKYTRGHSEAVARTVVAMARQTGAGEDEIEMLRMAARLHDIGKIGIRDDVLLKPGKLTAEEFAIIKQHPVIGADILRSIPSLHEVVSIVLQHHERLDGKGYPQGLKGSEISMSARMMAVADTYDALTSDRPYRPGKSHPEAMQIIEDVRGTQLCPECIDLLERAVDQSAGLAGPATASQAPLAGSG